MAEKKLKGVWSLLCAAFKPNYEFDSKSYRENIDYYIELGVDGIIVNGSIGEFTSLSIEERKHVLEICMDQVDGRVPVGNCPSSCNTLECIELSQHTKQKGGSVIMVLPPYFWRPSDDDIVHHYKMISENVDIPIMVYHNPALSKVYLSPKLIKRIMQLPNVTCMKETFRDPVHLFRVIETGIRVFGGSDAIALNNLQLGGHGIISSPLRAKEMVQLYEAFQSGDLDLCLSIQKKVNSTYIGGEEVGKLLPWTKMACNIRGINVGPPRPPYQQLSADEKEDVENLLSNSGYLE